MDAYLLVPLLLVLLVTLVVVNKRQKKGSQPAAQTGKQVRTQAAGNKKSKKQAASQAIGAVTTQRSDESEPATTGNDSDEDWDWQPAAETTMVSVESVDHLTEYKVYKQFGYFQKAADSLLTYLKHNGNNMSKDMHSTLVAELAGLCLEAKNPDLLAEILDHYRSDVDKDKQEDFIRRGLQLDSTNLPLRVLAEELLGWGVKKAEEEMGLAEDNTLSSADAVADAQSDASSVFASGQARMPLVEGNVHFFQVRGDEQEVLLSFTQPQKSYQLLKRQLPYDAAVRCLNKAIKQTDKPASLIIDALALDYRHHNLSVFAQHLWRLYYSLGQYGQKVKEHLLGWGYNLGHHPMFDELATKPTETELREIGVAQGFIPMGSSAMKAKRRPVVEAAADASYEAETPAEMVLRDVESLLAYGQLEQALDLLEESILKYPQESQLYITLFDLYERAEDWPRLQKMLQTIRSEIKTPPEEVVLAMSQLLQRINHSGVQNK